MRGIFCVHNLPFPHMICNYVFIPIEIHTPHTVDCTVYTDINTYCKADLNLTVVKMVPLSKTFFVMEKNKTNLSVYTIDICKIS